MSDRPNTIYLGDSFAVLPTLEADSFDACVTDPPYGIRFMGKAWDGADIEQRTQERAQYRSNAAVDPRAGQNGGHNSIAAEAGKYDRSTSANVAFEEWTREWAKLVYRILKPGAHLVCFASTRTYHRMVCGIEDAGFEIRDQLAWTFGSGFPKSSNQDGAWQGWGTALKPAWEPICLARKPLIGTVPENLAAHRTGALNIDACRIAVTDATYARNASGDRGHEENRKREMEFGMTAGKANDLGRWPANLCHDGSDEVVACFPSEAGAAAPVTVRNADKFRGTYGTFAGNRDEQGSTFHGDAGSAARFYYCAKADRDDRDAGCEAFAKKPLNWSSGDANPGSFQSEGTDKSARNPHPTVKPTDLMRWLCRLVTPPGGRIIDPFLGSGSTGRGAVLEAFSFVGIEREEEYAPVALARIREAEGEMFARTTLVDRRQAK